MCLIPMPSFSAYKKWIVIAPELAKKFSPVCCIGAGTLASIQTLNA